MANTSPKNRCWICGEPVVISLSNRKKEKRWLCIVRTSKAVTPWGKPHDPGKILGYMHSRCLNPNELA